MARASTTATQNQAEELAGIDPEAVYEIKVSRPFVHGLTHYMPGDDKTYHVKGKVLVNFKDKVSEFFPIS